MEFKSFRAAFNHARLSTESHEATVILFDVFGKETMEFRLNLPESQLRLIFRKPKGKRGSRRTPSRGASVGK